MSFKILAKAFEDELQVIEQQSQPNDPEISGIDSTADTLPADEVQEVVDVNTQAMDESVEIIDNEVAELNSDSDAAVAFEELARRVLKDAASGKITATSLAYLNVGVEHMRQTTHLRTRKTPVYSMEGVGAMSTNAAARMAAEGLMENAQQLWGGIKTKLSNIAEQIANRLNLFRASISSLSKTLDETEQAVSAISSGSVPNAPVVKPGAWGSWVTYSDSGVDKGLKNVFKDVKEVLGAHAQVVSKTSDTTASWLEKNYDKALTDDSVFSGFKVKPNSFMILGAKKTTADDPEMAETKKSFLESKGSIYKSRDLPGCRNLFISTSENDVDGEEAIATIGSTFYFMALSKRSEGYKKVQAISRQMAMKVDAIYYSSARLLGAKAGNFIGKGSSNDNKRALFGTAAGAASSATNDAGAAADLSKDVLFEVLSLQDMKRAINECKQIIEAAQKWQDTMVNEVLKDPRLDKIANDQFGPKQAIKGAATAASNAVKRAYPLKKEDVAVPGGAEPTDAEVASLGPTNTRGQTLTRKLIYALLAFNTGNSQRFDTYAIKVATAALQYVAASAKTYAAPAA